MSSILPLRSTGYHPTIKELNSLNDDISYINDKLRRRASAVPNLRIIDHPQFVNAHGFVNDYLLAADGLYLSFEGTVTVVRNFESAMWEVKYSNIVNKVNKLFNDTEVVMPNTETSVPSVSVLSARDSPKDDKLPYSDVVRFGDKRDQPVLRSRTEISCARPNIQNTVVKRRGTVNRKRRRENRTPPTYRSIQPKS